MYDNILVPTDGSDHAGRAADHAATLARAFDAVVHLVSVVDLDEAAGPFSAGGLDEAYVDKLTESGRSTVEDDASRLDGVETVQEVLTGRPADSIIEYVSASAIDLVVMGTHGRTGLSRYLTGSVAERVLRRAPAPVMTVRATDAGEPTDGYDGILLPTDGSEPADFAVAHALAIADRFDSRLHVASVVNVGDLATGTETGMPSGLLAELKSSAERAAQSVADDAADAGIDAVTSVTVGRPKGELLTYVEDHDIDLVVMGTHGRTGLDRVLVGSTAEALVRQADVPVLTASRRPDGDES